MRSLMASQPIDVASSDRHTVKPWFNGKLPESPRVVDLTTQGFPLVGGRIDVIGLTPAPTLVYRHRLHVISLTALPARLGADAAACHRRLQHRGLDRGQHHLLGGVRSQRPRARGLRPRLPRRRGGAVAPKRPSFRGGLRSTEPGSQSSPLPIVRSKPGFRVPACGRPRNDDRASRPTCVDLDPARELLRSECLRSMLRKRYALSSGSPGQGRR